MERDFQKVLIEEIVEIIAPIRDAGLSVVSTKRFFRALGWNFDDHSGLGVAKILDFVSEFAQLISTVQDLIDSEDPESLEQILTLLNSVKKLFEKIQTIVDSFSEGGLLPEEVSDLLKDIPHVLLLRYLQINYGAFTESLRWIEVIQPKKSDETKVNIANKIVRYPYHYEIFNFENLSKFIQSPNDALRDIYVTPFDLKTVDGAKGFSDKLFPRIGQVFTALGGTYIYGIKPEYKVNFGTVGNDIVNNALTLKFQTRLSHFMFGLTILYSPEERGNLGWVIVPFGNLSLDAQTKSYQFLIESQLQVGAIIINDDKEVSLVSSDGFTQVNANATVKKLGNNQNGQAYLIGEKEGTRLEIGEVSIGASMLINSAINDFDVFFKIERAKIFISGKGQDGFISAIIPEEGLEIPFDFIIGYSTKKSLYFGANAGLILALPVHVDILGIIKINEIYLEILTKEFGLAANMAVTGSVFLGPLKASFERIGLSTKFDWTKEDKNLGFADLSLGFKPPNGLGLAIDAGVVKGGGYLFFDHDRGEYAGALELVFSEWIALKAIGLITTKLPDGSKGFSMIIIITVEFGTGIQLGYGFTLLGVGGLLGLNRTVNIEPLAQGVRTGAIESVMFPQDVVANAPRIISDLRQFFPPEQGTFLIGPMAKIGWGTPTLVSASLGVIIEFPDVTITILGVLKVILPDESADVLRLQVNFIGRIEPSNKLMWFYAELFDSRVLFITLEGGMGMLVNWGDNSNFVFTVGGFHPRFSPPPLPFPEPPRIAVNILNTSIARIRIEGYFAVTSNTVQFGVRAEMFFGFSAFKVEGHISFDALFQFDPFYFIIEFSAGMSVKVFGFGLFSFSVSGLLEGPTKWRVKGAAKKKITWFGPTIKVRINKTWGEGRQTELPPIEVFPLIEKEFAAITNWEAVVPAGSSILVTLRQLGESAPGTADQSEIDTRPLVLHPVGTLRISQRKIPLDLKLDKVGNQRPTDANKLSVTANIAGGGTLAITDTREKFATGEFRNLSNAQKLSSPGFELYDSGIEIKPEGEQLKTSMAVKRIVRYETIIIDNNFKRHLVRFYQILHVAFTAVYSTLFTHFLKGGAVTKSVISQHYRKQIQPNEVVIKIEPNQYTVAFNDTNKPIDATAMRFTNQASAIDYMQEQTRLNPNAAPTMHVIPNTEVNIAA